MIRNRFLILFILLALGAGGYGLVIWLASDNTNDQQQGLHIAGRSVHEAAKVGIHLTDGSTAAQAGTNGATVAKGTTQHISGLTNEAVQVANAPVADLARPRAFFDGVPIHATDASGFADDAARGASHGFAVLDDVGRGASHAVGFADDLGHGATRAVGLVEGVGRGAASFADDAAQGGAKLMRYLFGGGAAAAGGAVAVAKRKKS